MSDFDVSRKRFMSISGVHAANKDGENGQMANYIKHFRKINGWSMEQLGEACRPPCTGSQINKLEKGQVQLTQNWMNRLGEALEVNPTDLLDGGGEILNAIEQQIFSTVHGLSEPTQRALLGITKIMAENQAPIAEEAATETTPSAPEIAEIEAESSKKLRLVEPEMPAKR